MVHEQPPPAGRGQDMALIGRLQQVPLFHRLSGRYLGMLRKVARPCPLAQGQTLIAEGTVHPGIYVLLKGTLALGKGGPDVVIQSPVTTVGETPELSGHPQSVDVSVTEAGVALHLPHPLLAALWEREADLQMRLSKNLVSHLAARLLAANRARTELADRRGQLARELESAQAELNDARLLSSMR